MVPSAEEMGFCDVVEVQEIGDTNVVVFRQGTTAICVYSSLVPRPSSLTSCHVTCDTRPSSLTSCHVTCGTRPFAWPPNDAGRPGDEAMYVVHWAVMGILPILDKSGNQQKNV